MTRRALVTLVLLALSLFACSGSTEIGAVTPDYIDTGIDPGAWVLVPAGAFPFGQHDHLTIVDYDYEIMVTTVTNAQYAAYLNEALASGAVTLGAVEVEAGDRVWIEECVAGYYPGEPCDGYKHEEEIRAGNKLYLPLEEEGLRIRFDGQTFSALKAYANHPATMVTWFGADAYCDYFGWRLLSEIEWEKAARGSELVDGRGRPFPRGTEIAGNNANYYSSFDLYEKLSGKLGNTMPVGLYNGRTNDGYETLDSASPSTFATVTITTALPWPWCASSRPASWRPRP